MAGEEHGGEVISQHAAGERRAVLVRALQEEPEHAVAGLTGREASVDLAFDEAVQGPAGTLHLRIRRTGPRVICATIGRP